MFINSLGVSYFGFQIFNGSHKLYRKANNTSLAIIFTKTTCSLFTAIITVNNDRTDHICYIFTHLVDVLDEHCGPSYTLNINYVLILNLNN